MNLKTNEFRILIIIVFILNYSFSQNILIKGSVRIKNNNKLPNAIVALSELNKDAYLTYSISNSEGNYELHLNSKLDSLQINVSYVGFSKELKKISNKNQTIDFVLKESDIELKEVFIKTPPISKNKDTLNYLVSSFIEQKDRVISDVLRKLPGIEVQNDGRILYQGKPIQKYYIEGLDLLEGKYNIANNNLPADAVSKVQILENHQPIKLLDSLVFTDKASLNIQLKNKMTMTGLVKTGIGLPFLLRDVNLTPMLFSKKQQMITTYQTNNIGYDVNRELKTLTIDNLLEQLESNNFKSVLVDIQQLSPPPFSEKRWLDNNANLLSTNYLVRLKNDIDLKINLSYLHDLQNQKGITETNIFTLTDTINIAENKNNSLSLNSFQSKFILTKNTKENYFKNDLEINNFWDAKKGVINGDNSTINQEVKNPFNSFSNKLKWIHPVGKKLVTINSNIALSNTLQKLTVSPGQYENLLNQGNHYDKLIQKVNLSNFYTNNAISFIHGYNKFTFTPKLGFNFQNQNLNSNLTVFENDYENTLSGYFKNTLSYEKAVFYTSLNTQLKYNSWTFGIVTPFAFQWYHSSDKHLNKDQSINQITFEPNLLIIKEINAFWKASFSTSLDKKFGNIDQLYNGFILNNYRNITKFEAPISEQLHQKYRLDLSYRNPIKSVFSNISYAINNTKNNLLFNSKFDENGASMIEAKERDNYGKTHYFSLSGSKYFSDLKTTLTLTSTISTSKYQQLLNGNITDSKTTNQQMSGKINSEIANWFSLAFNNKLSYINTKLGLQSFNRIKTQQYALNFYFYLSNNQSIGFDTELYKNDFITNKKENYFANINYRYTFEKRKIDLEFNWNNILNTKKYITAYNDSFYLFQNTYELRPSQLLISLKFNF
ncbi:MAG: carboxypeptidase-like regulatory domain-containing protein [Flavobacteriaceae bacterium]|nr:carboxypeptidase-like regulatory domain-containing protein [Flavobacteriaceae bacterium]